MYIIYNQMRDNNLDNVRHQSCIDTIEFQPCSYGLMNQILIALQKYVNNYP